jgi:nitrogen regulatory protein P-II 2
MNLSILKLVTIIADNSLKQNLLDDIKALGAKGYTLTEAEGEGSHGSRLFELEGENIKLELIVSESVAEKIIERLADKYFERYGVVSYVQTVEVLRGNKFI